MDPSSLLLCVALAQAPPPAGSKAPAPVKPAPTVEEAEAARAARIAAERVRCEALVKAIDAFGHRDEFAAKMRSMFDGKTDRFIPIRDGWLTDVMMENWLLWNVPTPGSTEPPSVDTKSQDHPYAAIVDLSRQLRAHDIDFLLVTFPTRAQLYPDLFMDLPDPPGMAGFAGFCSGTARFDLALLDAGVEVLYLAPEFVAARYGADGDKNDQLYLRANQHWTPRGAELAARLVAERIAQYPWFEPGPAREGRDWLKRDDVVSAAIVYGGAPEGAVPERFNVHKVVPMGRFKLDDVRPSSPIVLLSGSFADFHRNSQCDFTSQLYRFGSWPVDKMNPKGGIEDACRQALAARPHDQLKKKKLVVWMVAEQAFKPGSMWRPFPIFKE